MQKLNSDIYDITGTVVELQKDYLPEETEETLALGTYGYFADINSLQLQNSIIMGQELGNEIFPSKAKFDKNIISHALSLNITDINAKPSVIKIILGIEEEILINLFKEDTFVLDKKCPIHIDDFEFHMEYDIIITRTWIANEDFVYTARYDMGRRNPLSDITNPYLNTPFIQVQNGTRYLFIPCQLMQVEQSTLYRKLITNNAIDNKTFEFEFLNQLSNFEIKVTEGEITKYLTPVFEGVGIENNVIDYCLYTYIDSNTIRVRFDSISYLPGINADVEIYVNTTQGASGNFEYRRNFFTLFSSTRFNYKNLSLIVMPTSNAADGMNRKPIDELRKMIPKETLSRGSITNMQDIQNYFNMLDTNTNIMRFQKKVDNQFERSYYAYLVLKDEYNNVIPTNTIDVVIPRDDFDTNENRKYVLKQGCYIYYDGEKGTILAKNDPRIPELVAGDKTQFLYTLPFTLVVTGDPLYVSYYMSIMNYATYLEFTYINQKSALQFISTSIGWTRKYISDPNVYKLNLTITQNISSDKKMLELDDNNNVIKNNMKVVAVMYNADSDAPYRYAYADMTSFDYTSKYSYDYEFKFNTNDILNDDNKIRIENVYVVGTTGKDYGYFTPSIKMKIYVLGKLEEGEFGRADLNSIIPIGLEGYTVCNVYDVTGGLDFYTNYSDIVTSTITSVDLFKDHEPVKGFSIKSVPVVRHTYVDDESTIQYFVNQLDYKKAYIDKAITLLENNFLVDFKFFNTYGPSKIFSTDRYGEKIVDRVNLTLNFEIKLVQASDKYTKNYILKDIKDIIEDLNDMYSLHIPNIITTITNNYRNSIEYIEFIGFNQYGADTQHLNHNEYDDVSMVPEFLTVHTLNDMSPDINIRLA